MIQTDISSNATSNFSFHSSEPQPITWTNSSFIPSHSIDRRRLLVSDSTHNSTSDSDTHNLSSTQDNDTEDDNIDWEFVTKQLEAKLRTSVDFIPTESDESYCKRLSPKIPKKYRFHPIKNQPSTAIHQTTSQNDETQTVRSESPIKTTTNQNKQIPDQIETNLSTFSAKLDYTSTIHELLNELIACQQKQAYLLEQIQELMKQSERMPTSISSHSSTFFLPLNSFNNNSKHSPSLQDACRQRKSLFIRQSKERVNQIYRHNNKYHHRRIIPNIKQTNNTYLQERRQYEKDRLCEMIIKHQNRQNAKIYGNLIKNQLCYN